ncbi:predicted protein [Verticillium alfalfae VaMs.102]|uniref:Predicted protein n=1 Tax=Verticillium alfalfae (strain VaMs.102 / ATCC MYA-4576 / FGSC 10136) TaxID=526221 RepID=C9SPL2_VERA1|nr:predicted protein [Verticillium alfalfae VaMs.102]EEY20727.1 predicted protein [Verticillium alfalfae VaMs.102]
MAFLFVLGSVGGTPIGSHSNSTKVQYVIHGVNTKLIGPITISLVITSLMIVLLYKNIKQHRAEITALISRKKSRTASVIALPPSPATGGRQANTADEPDEDDGFGDVGDVTELIDMPVMLGSSDADIISLRTFLADTDLEQRGKSKPVGAKSSAGKLTTGSELRLEVDIKGKAKAKTTPNKGARRVSWGKTLYAPSPEPSVQRGSRAPRRETPRLGESEAGPSGTHGYESDKEKTPWHC